MSTTKKVKKDLTNKKIFDIIYIESEKRKNTFAESFIVQHARF
jgi:hypothetical protein